MTTSRNIAGQDHQTGADFSRRCFLAGTAVALGMPCFVPASALGRAGRPAASERITVGVIGQGNRAPTT